MDALDDAIFSSFVFRRRTESIPADMRPVWRIALILLVLQLSSRGGKSSFGRLQLFNWALLHQEGKSALLDVLAGNNSPTAVMVRIEPSLNRAVDFASAAGLVKIVNGDRVEITSVGQSEVRRIIDAKDLFLAEIAFLNSVGRAVTETLVAEIFRSNRR